MNDYFGVVELGCVTHSWERLVTDDFGLDPLLSLGIEDEDVIQDLLPSVSFSPSKYDKELSKIG